MAQKRKNSKKWIFWVLMLVLFMAAAVVCYLVWSNYFRDKKEDKPTEEQSLVEKYEEKKVEEKEEETAEKEKVVQYEGGDPNTQEELTGVVTYAGVNGDNLMIRVNIDQYLESGKCELSLTQDGVAYSDVVGIVGSAATATCEGFNVPVSGLGGDYEIVIKISSGDKAGIINGKVKI